MVAVPSDAVPLDAVPCVAAPSDAATVDAATVDPSGDVASVFARHCVSRSTMEDVVSKWSVLALLALDEGGYRFNALRRRVDGVSEKMLSQTLQTLERDGMVTRAVVTAIPPRVEYSITPLGADVADRLRGLIELLEGSVADVAEARRSYDARPS